MDAGLPKPKLQLVGSCRNKADEERLQKLKELALKLNVENDVEFHQNIIYRCAFHLNVIKVLELYSSHWTFCFCAIVLVIYVAGIHVIT